MRLLDEHNFYNSKEVKEFENLFTGELGPRWFGVIDTGGCQVVHPVLLASPRLFRYVPDVLD